jgi:hypothetical protein
VPVASPRDTLPALIGMLLLVTSCQGASTECPGGTPAARAARAATAEAQLAALGEGLFTVASVEVRGEELVRWLDAGTLEGASTEETRLVFYRLRIAAELVFTGAPLPDHPLRGLAGTRTWDAVDRRATLLRVARPRGRTTGDRERVELYAIFDVTGPATSRFRTFDDAEHPELVPLDGCPDGRGGRL